MISPATLATIGATRPPSSVIQPARAPVPLGTSATPRSGAGPAPLPSITGPSGTPRGSLLDISV